MSSAIIVIFVVSLLSLHGLGEEKEACLLAPQRRLQRCLLCPAFSPLLALCKEGLLVVILLPLDSDGVVLLLHTSMNHYHLTLIGQPRLMTETTMINLSIVLLDWPKNLMPWSWATAIMPSLKVFGCHFYWHFFSMFKVGIFLKVVFPWDFLCKICDKWPLGTHQG